MAPIFDPRMLPVGTGKICFSAAIHRYRQALAQ
jgi:hypothetical protein